MAEVKPRLGTTVQTQRVQAARQPEVEAAQPTPRSCNPTPSNSPEITLDTKKGTIKTTGAFKETTPNKALLPDDSATASGTDPESGKRKVISAQILSDGTRRIVTTIEDNGEIRNEFDKSGAQTMGLHVKTDGTIVDLMGNSAECIEQRLLERERQLNADRVNGADASNQDGDTLERSTQRPEELEQLSQQSIPQFSLPLEKVKNLMNLGDGVIPGRDYATYPQRIGSENVLWNAGINEELKDSNPEVSSTGSYERSGTVDNRLDRDEAMLLQQQVDYARMEDTRTNYPVENQVSLGTALAARNLLASLYRNYNNPVDAQNAGQPTFGLDKNNDGAISYEELAEVAQADGNADLSNNDIRLVREAYLAQQQG